MLAQWWLNTCMSCEWNKTHTPSWISNGRSKIITEWDMEKVVTKKISVPVDIYQWISTPLIDLYWLILMPFGHWSVSISSFKRYWWVSILFDSNQWISIPFDMSAINWALVPFGFDSYQLGISPFCSVSYQLGISHFWICQLSTGH